MLKYSKKKNKRKNKIKEEKKKRKKLKKQKGKEWKGKENHEVIKSAEKISKIIFMLFFQNPASTLHKVQFSLSNSQLVISEGFCFFSELFCILFTTFY